MHVTSPLFYRLTQFLLYRIVKFFRLWMVSWKAYVSSTTDVFLHPFCACIYFGYWPIPSIFNCSAPFNFLKGSRQRGSLPIRRTLKSIRPPPQPHHHFRPSDRELGKKRVSRPDTSLFIGFSIRIDTQRSTMLVQSRQIPFESLHILPFCLKNDSVIVRQRLKMEKMFNVFCAPVAGESRYQIKITKP